MYRRGLVRKIDGTETVFDAIRKGIPIESLVASKMGQTQEIPETSPQPIPQIIAPNLTSGIAGISPQQQQQPDVVEAGANNSCPPGYTFALGYCVRDINYYGCIPGVEFWDGSKCSRDFPACPNGELNDLNTGKCPDTAQAVANTIKDLENLVETMQNTGQTSRIEDVQEKIVEINNLATSTTATPEDVVQTIDEIQNFTKLITGGFQGAYEPITDVSQLTVGQYQAPTGGVRLESYNPFQVPTVTPTTTTGNITVDEIGGISVDPVISTNDLGVISVTGAPIQAKKIFGRFI